MFHMIEDNKAYLTGAFDDVMKKYWCLIQDSVNEKKITIKKYLMKEVSEKDFFLYSLPIVLDHSGSMILTIGYGEKQLIADNRTEEGRALNRRTEFKVIKK